MPTRVFHWTLVATVAVSLFTGFLAPEWWLEAHLVAGYVIGALLLFRIVWWCYGFEYSRLSPLVQAIRNLPAFAGDLVRGRSHPHAGHNPAGSLMILVLIIMLAALTLTGFFVEGGEEKQGLLAGFVTFAAGDAAKELHELAAWLLIALIAGHVAGVVVESLLQKTPLIRGMVTGDLPLPRSVRPVLEREAQPRTALFVGAMMTAILVPAAVWMLRQPSLGVPSIPRLDAYEQECGDCHNAFHPSLLPRDSWSALMAGLDDHFGEDATLDAETTRNISAYLAEYSSETWDTEAANRLRRVSEKDPFRITASPYWVRKHSGIAPEIFSTPPVNSRSNCAACHGDAATGRFDDQQISIPQSQQKGTSP
jgi:cytochrome b